MYPAYPLLTLTTAYTAHALCVLLAGVVGSLLPPPSERPSPVTLIHETLSESLSEPLSVPLSEPRSEASKVPLFPVFTAPHPPPLTSSKATQQSQSGSNARPRVGGGDRAEARVKTARLTVAVTVQMTVLVLCGAIAVMLCVSRTTSNFINFKGMAG